MAGSDTATQAAKRPYLRPAERRRQLLDATSRVFARAGLAGITMVEVAAEADVSRRLVYDHFGDLATLFEAFFEDRLNRYLDAVERAAAPHGGAGNDSGESPGWDIAELLAIPVGELRAIRLIVSDTANRELDGPRRRLRAHAEQRWIPALDPDGSSPALSSALLWTVLTALLAIADQVADGELAAEQAAALGSALVEQIPTVLATARSSQHTSAKSNPKEHT
ncbi:MAG: TetR/AcrR family transcriptional regulator [Microthrixaceae bacterium]